MTMRFVTESQPVATHGEVWRLLLEVFCSIEGNARLAGAIKEDGSFDWRFYCPVDLLERWEADLQELYRRWRAGPPV